MTVRQSYHHGDLRAALIAAALTVVEQDGHEALSLRELAQALHVSPGAPYRHFPDRLSLFVAVSGEGFRRLFEQGLAEIAPLGTAREKLAAMVRSFYGFAAAHPQLFRLMFDSEVFLKAPAESPPAEYERRSYFLLEALLAEALPGLDPAAVKSRLITMWSTLYGFAKIRQAQMLKPYMLGDLDWEAVERAAVAAALGDLA